MEKIIEAIYELRGIKDRAGVNEPSEIVKKVMLKLGMNFNFYIFWTSTTCSFQIQVKITERFVKAS